MILVVPHIIKFENLGNSAEFSENVLFIIQSRISDHKLQHRAFEVQCPYGYWKVMEIENSIFQHLKSFGKESILFKWLWKRFGFLLGKILTTF